MSEEEYVEDVAHVVDALKDGLSTWSDLVYLVDPMGQHFTVGKVTSKWDDEAEEQHLLVELLPVAPYTPKQRRESCVDHGCVHWWEDLCDGTCEPMEALEVGT